MQVFDRFGGPAHAPPVGKIEFEALLATGDPQFEWKSPSDEFDPIALLYSHTALPPPSPLPPQ
jgi:hypothetical protein